MAQKMVYPGNSSGALEKNVPYCSGGRVCYTWHQLSQVSWLYCSNLVSLLVFFLLILSIIDWEVLKSPTVTVNSSLQFYQFFRHVFWVSLLIHKHLRLCLLHKLIPLSLQNESLYPWQYFKIYFVWYSPSGFLLINVDMVSFSTLLLFVSLY